jgi:hypothetical protein
VVGGGKVTGEEVIRLIFSPRTFAADKIQHLIKEEKNAFKKRVYSS